jgi:hypothetical protein
MANNNVQIFFKNFQNFEFTKYFDPEALKSLVIPNSSDAVEFKIINSGELKDCTYPAVPDDVTCKINAACLKRDNLRLYNALIVKGSDLGSAVFSSGIETVNFSTVRVSNELKLIGNPGEFSDVVLKFVK